MQLLYGPPTQLLEITGEAIYHGGAFMTNLADIWSDSHS